MKSHFRTVESPGAMSIAVTSRNSNLPAKCVIIGEGKEIEKKMQKGKKNERREEKEKEKEVKKRKKLSTKEKRKIQQGKKKETSRRKKI